jgi:predicted small secreted protein
MKDRVLAWISLNGSTVGVAALIIVAVVMITGCGTVSGFGKDVQGAAEWTKDKMTGDRK